MLVPLPSSFHLGLTHESSRGATGCQALTTRSSTEQRDGTLKKMEMQNKNILDVKSKSFNPGFLGLWITYSQR